MVQVIEQTEDLSLVTDGELFIITSYLKSVLMSLERVSLSVPQQRKKKGVKVRVKNKGDQAHKKGLFAQKNIKLPNQPIPAPTKIFRKKKFMRLRQEGWGGALL